MKKVNGKGDSPINDLNASLFKMLTVLSNEYSGIFKNNTCNQCMEKWRGLVDRNAPLQERLELAQINLYIEKAQKYIQQFDLRSKNSKLITKSH